MQGLDGCRIVFDSNDVVEVRETVGRSEQRDDRHVDVAALLAADGVSVAQAIKEPLCPALAQFAAFLAPMEPMAMEPVREPVPAGEGDSVLEDSHMELDPELAPIPVDGGIVETGNEEVAGFSDLEDGGSFDGGSIPAPASVAEKEREIMAGVSPYRFFASPLVGRSWAGPDHWTLSRAKSRKPAKGAKEPRKKPVFEFGGKNVKPSQAFPSGKRSGELQIPAGSFMGSDHVLPEDHHYSLEVVKRGAFHLVFVAIGVSSGRETPSRGAVPRRSRGGGGAGAMGGVPAERGCGGMCGGEPDGPGGAELRGAVRGGGRAARGGDEHHG